MSTYELAIEELNDLTTELCQIGEDRGINAEQFALMLTIIAKNLCEAQGIEVHSERRVDA